MLGSYCNIWFIIIKYMEMQYENILLCEDLKIEFFVLAGIYYISLPYQAYHIYLRFR